MRKFTLGEWASIAEIIAAVGVVVSLFFVGLEVRRNTRAVQAATLQSVIDIARQQLLLVASNPELNHISHIDGFFKGEDQPAHQVIDQGLQTKTDAYTSSRGFEASPNCGNRTCILSIIDR